LPDIPKNSRRFGIILDGLKNHSEVTKIKKFSTFHKTREVITVLKSVNALYSEPHAPSSHPYIVFL